jgi:ubiquinone/menaquinone biosynthesis C-methylase UbiE
MSVPEKASFDQIQEYYGKVLGGSHDLKTNACCSTDAMPPHLKAVLKEIEPEILNTFYGCGAPIPEALDGCTVLDLGCGTGRDAYLAARLAGPKGRVIGIDMTAEQLEVARRNLPKQMDHFGYVNPNVSFEEGYIEDLAAVGIADESIDVVISDCVINLSPAKERVFREIFRVLKPGGELYFSDVFADRRLPLEMMDDAVLHGECLAGALYLKDFHRIMSSMNCHDVRQVTARPITIQNADIEAVIGMAKFSSVTVRAFKLDTLEDSCEDYGQVAYYHGTIPGYPHTFALDEDHEFTTGKPMLVCGNTASMIEETRLARHFEVRGDRSAHFGAFVCGGSGDEDTQDCC